MSALGSLRSTLASSPRATAAIGVTVSLLVVAGAAIGPVVRGRVAREASRRGLVVEVGSVRPGFFAVSLRDVDVSLDDGSMVQARLDTVQVDLSAALSVSRVAVTGGSIKLEGEPEALVERVRRLRPEGASGGGDSPRRHTALDVTGVAVDWNVPSGGSMAVRGLHVARTEDGYRIGAESARANDARLSLEVLEAELELAEGMRPRRVSADSVALVRRAEKGMPDAAAATPKVEVPSPPPLPVAVRTTRGSKATKEPDVEAPPGPVLPLPDLVAARRRLRAIAGALDERLPEGLRVDVPRLSLEADLAGQAATFGPAPFSLERRGGRIFVTFTSDKTATQATPLGLELELPLGDGEVTARLSGGPVPLSALGLREGTLGLSDVANARASGKGQLALAADGSALTFDVELGLSAVAIEQPRLSPAKIRDLAFGVAARGVLTSARLLRLDTASLDMGALHLRTHGTVEDPADHFGLSLAADVAPAACQAILESAPRGLLPTIEGARMTGTLGATGRIVFDTRTMDKMLLDYQVDAGCHMAEVSRDLARDRFEQEFVHQAYHPDGKAFDFTTGPGSDAWTPIDEISPFVVAALLTTEDGAFYKHKGFNHAAIKQSVLANLKARRFVRGASTITMQLAKNLFLSRAKNLSRKMEEVVLADYLEQAFTKDELMELYLNVVEFGPDVYGVKQAAAYYFGRKPEEIDVAEAFFLASLLPSPVRYGKMRDKGQPPESWTRHLTLLMEIAQKRGKLTEAELDMGKSATIAFVKPGDPPLPPRRPFTTKRRDPYEDDAAWTPVE